MMSLVTIQLSPRRCHHPGTDDSHGIDEIRGIDDTHGIDDTDDFRQEDEHGDLNVTTLQCVQLLFLLDWLNGS
jgi:hypothetical protein